MIRDLAVAALLVTASRTSARILTPNDGLDYIDALATTNRFCPVRCAAKILEPDSTEELAEWMRSEGHKHDHITVKGGGHSYGCQSVPKDGGMMIHTGLLKEAEVVKRADGTAYARLGAGNNFQDIMPQLNKMGYAIPHGECITVGLAGWLLNNGNHPETLNYARYYKEKPFLNKMTAVDYDGNVFTIDKNGVEFINANPAVPTEALVKKQNATAVLGNTLEQAMMAAGRPLSPAASSSLRLMQTWGASLIIATEFEIELLPRQEPDYITINYPLHQIEKDGTLLQRLVDFTGSLNEEDWSCGTGFMTEGIGKGVDAFFVKCVDWNDNGAHELVKMMPKGKGHVKPKVVPYGAFFTWNKNSYGMGWTPQFFYEPISVFDNNEGVEKWRQVMIEMGKDDSPCRSCMTELNRVPQQGMYTFDIMCGAHQNMQNDCSDATFKWQQSIVGDRFKFYKQNLPSCRANPNWQQQMIEYGPAYDIAKELKSLWDPKKVVDFWLSIGHQNSDQECEATHVQDVGATCEANGITARDLVRSKKRDARERCPKVFRYHSTAAQNKRCGRRWGKRAEDFPIIRE